MQGRRTGAKRANLTGRVIEALRARIRSGEVRPGDRLPTEPQLTEEFGVSRTVIREAIAGLRADGLVEPRQGVGVFVREPPPAVGLRLPEAGAHLLSAIIETLELRTAVEIEAAGIAAERASPAQAARIRECLAEIDGAIARGERSERADFAFHLAIAEATNNPLFAEFLGFLGRRTIPRSQLPGAGELPEGYLAQIQSEHRAILEAIAGGDAMAARSAMRVHLRGSLERYQALVAEGRRGAGQGQGSVI